MYKRFLTYAFVCSSSLILAQTPTKVLIKLNNPSFEGVPRAEVIPSGWFDCGFPGETPPDTQADGTIFGVNKPPYHGSSYLGLVTRDNDTWEKVSQRLSRPLEKGKKYKFSIYLTRSERYLSPTKNSPGTLVNYTTPIKLRIWGGNNYCERIEMLGETVPVKNTDWKRYDFTFAPGKTHTFILFEAYFNTPSPFPYNGNLLVDYCSDIEEIQDQIAAVQPPKQVPPKQTPPKQTPPKQTPPKTSPPKSTPPSVLPDAATVKAGQVIRVEQISFPADSSTLTSASFPVLDELYRFLQNNPKIKVEVGGHTNGIPPPEFCDRLSAARAKAVVEYLIDKGISSERLTYKGYGKRFPIASNSTPEGRKKNQRVEVKILSVG